MSQSVWLEEDCLSFYEKLLASCEAAAVKSPQLAAADITAADFVV